jgi:hypothetical protein
MADCPNRVNCSFFDGRMKGLDGLADLYRLQYCRSEFARCARYRVAQSLGKSAVPGDLYPPQGYRVEELLAEHLKRS